ncbi:MAG: PHP domain-containing protein [Lachnospiraceae bacterium]|nr:PHP domain-containing protein [Lachnospiraceae bacterium]MDE6627199.1 PHP domain-containing protein [Lachnospiraceae bacterium]
MNTIDLHVHSSASDGSLTPEEVVDLAKETGLRYFALTDHDTVDGVARALAQAEKYDNLDVIPGIELSCYYQSREIHIVGLFVDHTNEVFLQELKKLKQAREDRNEKMVQNFVAAGIPMTVEELKHGNPNSVITRAHFARVLIEKGVCRDKTEVFDKYLGIGCPFYLPKPKVSPEHVLHLIKSAGGAAILAHPYSYKFTRSQVEALLDELIPLGLCGMECYYSTYEDSEMQELRSIALSKNLLVSGGSDFHGAVKPDISIGTGRNNLCIPEKLLSPIREAAR